MKIKSPKHLPKHQRPREKMIEVGARALSNIELLQIIIGSGNKHQSVAQIARKVDAQLQHNHKIQLEQLRSISGIGEAGSTKLAASIELARRIVAFKHKKYTKPQHIVDLVTEYADKNREYLILLTINGAHELINKRIISIGTLDSALIHPREVFRPAIMDRAAGIFLVHNHPSGEVKPSREDVDVTELIKDSGELIGIELIDHVIIARKGGYYSFKQAKML